MPKIQEIGVNAIDVPRITVGEPIPPPVLPVAPPVTSSPFPVIDMPGCVRARISSGSGVESFEEDPNGVVTLCQGAVPVFEAADYRPNQAQQLKPPRQFDPLVNKKEPDVSSPAQAALPNASGASPDIPRMPIDPPCPPFGSQSLGSYSKLGNKVLAGYELQNGECVKIWDPVPVGQVLKNYIPDAAPLVSVSVTAAVATTVAIFAKPIASVLQKLAKPLTKKIVKKINQKLGRREKLESLQERRVVQRHRNQAIRDLRRALGK